MSSHWAHWGRVCRQSEHWWLSRLCANKLFQLPTFSADSSLMYYNIYEISESKGGSGEWSECSESSERSKCCECCECCDVPHNYGIYSNNTSERTVRTAVEHYHKSRRALRQRQYSIGTALVGLHHSTNDIYWGTETQIGCDAWALRLCLSVSTYGLLMPNACHLSSHILMANIFICINHDFIWL